MAKKLSRKKEIEETLKQLAEVDEELANCKPSDTYIDRVRQTDKNGNVRDIETTVCPYSDLLNHKSTLIKQYNDLRSNDISVIEIAKTAAPYLSMGLTAIFFFSGLEFEKNNCFTYETFKNFLRKPKP